MTERKKKLFRDILDVCRRRCLTARFGQIHFKDEGDGDIGVYAGKWFIMLHTRRKLYIGHSSYEKDSDEVCQEFFYDVDDRLKREHIYTLNEMRKSAQRMEAKSESYSPKFF